jgi:hypothetical protein
MMPNSFDIIVSGGIIRYFFLKQKIINDKASQTKERKKRKPNTYSILKMEKYRSTEMATGKR